MQRIFRRKPTPSFVVAVVALFVAMGGSAYALVITGSQVRNNSLTGADIRDVKGYDIRNYSITGRDIKRDSLGRVPIKEERLDASKLGKVKEAASADGFANLTAQRIEPFLLANNGSRELLRKGQLVLTAKCRQDGGNAIAEIIVESSVNLAAVDGDDSDAQLNVGESAQLAASTAALGATAFDQESDGAAISPDGTEILARDLYTGVNVLGQGGNQCRFGGLLLHG